MYCNRYTATIHMCLILSFVPTHKNINTVLTSQDLTENDIQVEPLEGSEASLLRPKTFIFGIITVIVSLFYEVLKLYI